MNPFEFVLIIVAMAFGMALIVKRMEMRGRQEAQRIDQGSNDEKRSENERLRYEIKELKDRLHVLERIAVEKENSLSREIDSLRD